MELVYKAHAHPAEGFVAREGDDVSRLLRALADHPSLRAVQARSSCWQRTVRWALVGMTRPQHVKAGECHLGFVSRSCLTRPQFLEISTGECAPHG